jgi:hypothetical protein
MPSRARIKRMAWTASAAFESALIEAPSRIPMRSGTMVTPPERRGQGRTARTAPSGCELGNSLLGRRSVTAGATPSRHAPTPVSLRYSLREGRASWASEAPPRASWR